jgi:hypothetical protein
MKSYLFVLMVMLSAPLAAERQPVLGDDPLDLRAQARACYLGFIELYDIDYFARPGAERCVEVSYLRAFSDEDLDEATQKVFERRHGSEFVERYRSQLQRVGAVYQPVAPGDRYTYCVDPQAGGLLLRDGSPVIRFEESDFAERFMQIWVKSDRPQGEPEWGFGQC